jgi:hypothetical protein
MKKRLLNRKRLLQLALSLCLILVSANSSLGQGVTQTTPGTYSYTVPEGVTSIKLEAWGAGGAGGSAQTATSNISIRGGGGAGGSYATTTIAVTPGDIINYTVGTGGTGASSGFVNATASGTGGFSSATLNSTVVVKAQGGPGGLSATGTLTVNNAGGTAYSAGNTGNIGSSIWGGNGGNAINGTSGGSGGGGGSAGTASNGNNGTILGGVAVFGGGAGGNGSNANNAATPGTAGGSPGGGGAGALIRGTSTGFALGGSGGAGKVVISYPIISKSGSFSSLSTVAGVASGSTFIGVTGADMQSAITATASAGFEVSSDNTTFSSAITSTATSGSISFPTVYVRLAASATEGTYDSGTVTFTGTNAATVTATIPSSTVSSASVAAVTVSTTTLSTSFAKTTAGTNSTVSQSFTVSGVNLGTNAITIAAPTHFKISLTDVDANYSSSSIVLTPSSGTVGTTTIYVKYSPTGTGNISGNSANISIANTSVATQTVAVSGSGLNAFYYNSGSLATLGSWKALSNGSGDSPADFTTAGITYTILANATTNATWTVSGSNSNVIVGNGSAVSLTVADTFPIIGTIDAAANGSVVWQHVLASPTFGILNNDSEVHFAPAVAASYSFGATTAYGKLFIDGAGEVSVSNTLSTPTVKTALTVASGSTLSFTSNNNPTISINATATATINGKVITFKATGLFASTGSIPLIGAATLVLGETSTIEFGRPGSAQAVTSLPAGVSYANLTLSGLDSNKSLSGNTTVTGVFRVNGTGTSTFTTGSFDLTLGSNASAVFGPQAVLNITGGTTNFNSRPVTLQSSVNGTARIGTITGNIIGATNVTVERYIPAKRAWRALTAPVSTTGSIFANWQEGGTGNGVNGFDIWMPGGINGLTAGGSSNSLLEYNSADNAWTGITATNGSSSMMNGDKNKPFMAFVTGPYGTGNITSNSAATTLRATGSLLIGEQTYTTVANKYTFIGNPYASPLDLSVMMNTSENAAGSFEGNVWVWDANASGSNAVGTYNLFNSGTYTNFTSNPVVTSGTLIQSGQAFFVKSTDGATFTIKEAHKGSTFSNAVFRNGTPPELLRVGLYKQINNEWSGRDGAMTVILSDANTNQTPNKMANGTENVAFTKNGLLFASNHHLPLVANDVLNVKVWNTTAGANYKLKINTEAFTATNLSASLEDLFTNATTPLTLDGSAVEYPFTVTNDALSTGDRFRIVFQNAVLGTINPTATSFSIFPNPVIGDSFQVNLGKLAKGTYSYSICNTIGQEVAKGTLNNATQNTNYEVKMTSAATGIYIMKINGSDNSVFTAKIIKK